MIPGKLETLISELEIERLNVLEVLKDLSSFNLKNTEREDRLASIETRLKKLYALKEAKASAEGN